MAYTASTSTSTANLVASLFTQRKQHPSRFSTLNPVLSSTVRCPRVRSLSSVSLQPAVLRQHPKNHSRSTRRQMTRITRLMLLCTTGWVDKHFAAKRILESDARPCLCWQDVGFFLALTKPKTAPRQKFKLGLCSRCWMASSF